MSKKLDNLLQGLPDIGIDMGQVTLPSTGMTVNHTPFLGEQQEKLAIAKEEFAKTVEKLTRGTKPTTKMVAGKKQTVPATKKFDEGAYIKAVRKLLLDCVRTIDSCFPDVELERLTEGDIPVLLAHLRKEHVDPEMVIPIKCPKCKGDHEVEFRLDRLELQDCKLSDEIVVNKHGVKVKVTHIPVIDQIKNTDHRSNVKTNFHALVSAIDTIIIPGKSTELGMDLTADATQLIVTKADNLPSTGSIMIDDETIEYASITGQCVSGLVRTNPKVHAKGTLVNLPGQRVNFRAFPINKRKEWYKTYCSEQVTDRIVDFLQKTPGFKPLEIKETCEVQVFKANGRPATKAIMRQVMEGNKQLIDNGKEPMSTETEECGAEIVQRVSGFIEYFL